MGRNQRRQYSTGHKEAYTHYLNCKFDFQLPGTKWRETFLCTLFFCQNHHQIIPPWRTITFLCILALCIYTKSLSPVRLFATLWIIAQQAPLSMGFSQQEYWSGLHFLLQRIFPLQGLNRCLFCLQHWQANSLPLYHTEHSDFIPSILRDTLI